jgi:hypothetical protein
LSDTGLSTRGLLADRDRCGRQRAAQFGETHILVVALGARWVEPAADAIAAVVGVDEVGVRTGPRWGGSGADQPLANAVAGDREARDCSSPEMRERRVAQTRLLPVLRRGSATGLPADCCFESPTNLGC